MPGLRYHAVAKTLHWLTALCVIGLIAIGLWMTGLPISLLKLKVYGWHKWIGLVVLILTLLRLGWRWYAPPPPLPGTVLEWERRLAPFSHGALLILLLALPISGWLMSSAGGVTVYWFGYLQLPDFVPREPHLFETLRQLHHLLAFTLIGLLAVHILAILHHDVVRHDGIFRRMWF